MIRTWLFTTFLLLALFVGKAQTLQTGADRLMSDCKQLNGKRIALVVNQTSVVGANRTHLVDTLLAKGINIKLLFAPEHGFRGTADAGEKVTNSIDSKSQLPIVSLYGKNKKPTKEQLNDVDVVIFDIQDVGARFYTYISTLYYVMEACAEQNKKLIVLDRPNPNDFVAGPVMQDSLRSFVGIVPIPLLHGLTVGELAKMINSEKWLKSKTNICPLQVVKMSGWKHRQPYSLPIKPSPNLPNDRAISLYPSLCFFEATGVSIGRGTTFPFQVIGYPDSTLGNFTFTPISLAGFEKNPLQKDRKCYGIDLRNTPFEGGFTLSYFLDFYRKSNLGERFFTNPRFFDQLVGNTTVRRMIVDGKSENDINEVWQKELSHYKKMRKQYLLYSE
ncbi:MAG: exo-beta-N-acetylmuramidase NamZ family protein [Bacteroidales bacterium]